MVLSKFECHAVACPKRGTCLRACGPFHAQRLTVKPDPKACTYYRAILLPAHPARAFGAG